MIVSELAPVSGTILLGTVLLFWMAVCFCYFNARLRQRLRWVGQWSPITLFSFIGITCTFLILAIVIAGSLWKIHAIQKRTILLMASAFVITFLGWLHDRIVQD